MRASELLVSALEAEGVRYVFGLPGEENLDVVEALRRSRVELVVTRHEQGAGFMAATWGRLSGQAGVCLATLGPGATNLVTAAAHAQLGAMPMVMLTGQKPVRQSKQGHFQVVDVVGMMRPLTKMTRQIASGAQVAPLLREAFRLAEEERPGAVHLELPEDVARDEVSQAPFERSLSRRPHADERAVAEATRAIAGAERPLLLVGAGANRKRTANELRALIERAGLPFVTTQMGKGVVDEGHPLWLGTAALSEGLPLHRAIERADVIVNVGHDVVEKPPFVMREGGPLVVHVGFSGASVDAVYHPQIEVVGDIASALFRIAQGLPERQRAGLFEEERRALSAMLGDGDERFAMHPARVVAEVRRAVPDDGVVCLDNGLYKLWFASRYRCRRPNTLLVDNALATMGAGLPSAMATKLFSPSKRVVSVCGDGGFLMSVGELETARRLGLSLVVLVLRDDAYGMIGWKQRELGHAPHGMTIGNPDIAALARAFGAEGHRVGEAGELGGLLSRCLEGGLHVVDVPIDYETTSGQIAGVV